MPKEHTILQLVGLRRTKGDIGIEVEVEGRDMPMGVPNPWRAVGDGSLRGGGVEYVLDKPCIRDKAEGHLADIYQCMKDSGGRLMLSARCAVHIHLNLQQWTLNQVMTFMVLYLVLEDLLVHWCGKDREGNIFCLRGRDADYLYDVLVSVMEAQHLNVRGWDANLRYSSMNISALKKYGSLEFRSLRTPKDYNRILEWIDLLMCVQKASKDFSHPSAVVEGMSNAGGEAFIRMIFGPLADKLMIPNLDQVLYEGARAVQQIVYTEPRQQDDEVVLVDGQPVVVGGAGDRAIEQMFEQGRAVPGPVERPGGVPRRAPLNWEPRNFDLNIGDDDINEDGD